MALEELIRTPVETLPPTARCVEAAALMRERNIGSVVVVQDKIPIGVVTDRDLVVRVIAEERDPSAVLLQEVMSTHPVFLSKHRSLDNAVEAMREFGVRRLPIVDDRGELAGIVSIDDILASMGRQIGQLSEAIQREIEPA